MEGSHPRSSASPTDMRYTYDRPEAEEVSIVVPLVERCPRTRAAFEALRHGLPPPDFTDSCNDEEPPRSKSLSTSNQPSNKPNRQPLAPFQRTVTPPTDEECGLPSALSVALSEIPTGLLPLSRTLASSQIATVINGHTRSELSESLAHAANLRRATGRARAILVIVSSEAAVREWITAMCQSLDEVQVISYSRARPKQEVTLSRLRQAQYPGIVVAAEKTLRGGVQDLWQALRENRIARKWEIVVSEATTDKNIEGECSPLRMLRDGTTEKGIIIARKGLTKTKACAIARDLRGVHVEKLFWLTKADIRNIAMEVGSAALFEEGMKQPAHTNGVKGKGKKSRQSREGKESHMVPGKDAVKSGKTSTKATKAVQPSQVTGKGSRKTPDVVKRVRNSNEPSAETNGIAQAVPSSSGRRKTSDGIVKSKKRKERSPQAKAMKRKVASDARTICGETEKVLSNRGDTKSSSKSPKIKSESAAGHRRLSDSVQRALLRNTLELPTKKTTSKKSPPAAVAQALRPRRRSPRLSPTLLSDEPSTISGAGNGELKQWQRGSGELSTEDEPEANRVKARNLIKPRRGTSLGDLGSSNRSSYDRKVSTSSGDLSTKKEPEANGIKVKKMIKLSRRTSFGDLGSLNRSGDRRKVSTSGSDLIKEEKPKAKLASCSEEPVPNLNKVRKKIIKLRRKKSSGNLGSSNRSSADRKVNMSTSEEVGKTRSRKTSDKLESRAHAFRLHSWGSSNSGEEEFFTPPSHAPTPQSKDTTPEKFVSPRTSFSPKKLFHSSSGRVPNSRTTPADQPGLPILSPARLHNGQTIKETDANPLKFTPQKLLSTTYPSSALKTAEKLGERKKRLKLTDTSSDDGPLVRKSSHSRRKTRQQTARRLEVRAALSNRRLNLEDKSSDGHPLVRNSSSKAKQKTGGPVTRQPEIRDSSKNRRLDLGGDSSDDQALMRKSSELKESAGRMAVRQLAASAALKNGTLEFEEESSDDQPSVRNRSPKVEQKTGRQGVRQSQVRASSKNRRLDFGGDSSKDQPSMRKSFDLKESTEGRAAIQLEGSVALKNGRLGFEEESSDDQPLVRKSSDKKQNSGQHADKKVFTPPDERRVPSRRSIDLATATKRSRGGRRKSVFDGLLRSQVPSENTETAIRRTTSFPPLLLTKREDSPRPQGFIQTLENPRHQASNAANRRKSLSTSSSSVCILPVKRALREQTRESQVTPNGAPTLSRAPRLTTASRLHRRSSITPPRLLQPLRSPVKSFPVSSNEVEPEVIVISSGSEDGKTPRQGKVSKRRRILEYGEPRGDSRNAPRVRPRGDTLPEGKMFLSEVPLPRDRLANGYASRRGSADSSEIPGDWDRLATFIRTPNGRKRQMEQMKNLSHKQKERFHKYAAEGKRFEEMGMRKQALESYRECIHIYEGDEHINDRFLALSSDRGRALAGGNARTSRKSPIRKSPIKKQLRRRRHSGKRGQAGPSIVREVIDLTSA